MVVTITIPIGLCCVGPKEPKKSSVETKKHHSKACYEIIT